MDEMVGNSTDLQKVHKKLSYHEWKWDEGCRWNGRQQNGQVDRQAGR